MKKNNEEVGVGVREIARRANVSIATVDRVIHNRTGVSEKTRKKIQGIIKDLNYQPNLLASRLASRKVYQFTTLIPEVSEETDFWEAPLRGIKKAEKEISQYGVSMKKHFFDLNDKASFVQQTRKILESKVDGILLAPSFIEESMQLAQACQEREIPYVFINSDIPNQDSLCYIGPHLVKSGYMTAHLMSYGMADGGKILVVNISKEIDNHHHLLRKEEGFRNYFKDHQKSNEIIKLDIRQTTYPEVEQQLMEAFNQHPDIQAVFATNSRVFSVAKFMEQAGKKDLLLIGYDFLKDNIEYLKKETIDFLICQKPEEQAYRGMMALYQHLFLGVNIDRVQYMPIDIITKENYEFYSN
uniref:LacI family DNA-binding transcriptional regulator n=1 Tax=Roseihalotalea indica TaxID=2867963 RepID=A0AA49GRD1_9BACT|nr:LacI family DNA-binding transcriptional regulator [Tunicatimonas sp. TK19036]